MVDRSVNVQLRADVRDYVAEMKRSADATKKVGDSQKELDRDLEKSQKTRQNLGKAEAAAYREAQARAKAAADAQRETLDQLGRAAALTGAAVGAGVLVAIDRFAEFDEAMSTVAADTHETTANLQLLRDAAMEAGADTKYSATEAAFGIDELAKAGVGVNDILEGGLIGSLSLASAGGLEVAEAAEIAATTLTQFELKGSDVAHVADLLAAGAGKAQGSVHDLGMALNQGGLVASQMGLSVEETTGTLAAFASAGLVGSDAGTSLKTALLMLANPSEKAAGVMSDLGLKAYDAAGNFVGMESIAGQLQATTAGLTQAQRDQAFATIFGSDAIRAANVLYTQGASGIRGWIDNVDDAGYAAVTSATKMDNLRGDLELLKGSLDTALISSGSGANDFLREQVQTLEGVVDAYNRLPEPVQRATIGVAGAGAAALVAGGAFLSVAPRVVDLAKNMRELDSSGSKVPGTLKNIAKAGAGLIVLSAAGAALSVYTSEADKAVLSSSEATKLLAETTNGVARIDASVKALSTGEGNGFDSLADGLKNLADPSLLDRLNDTSASILSFTGLYSAAGRPERAAFIEQLGAMGDGLANLVSAGAGEKAAEQFAAISEQAAAAGVSQEQLLDLMPAYRDALADQDTKQTLAAESAAQVGEGLVGITASAEDAESAVDALSDALDSILGAAFEVEGATDAYQKALNGLTAAAKENGLSLDGNTDEALANREAMRGLVGDGFAVIEAMARQGSSADELTDKSAKLKEAFITQATDAGYSAEAIAHYADQFDLIPAQVKTIVEANTTEADRQLQALVNKWAGKTVTVQAIMDTSGLNRSDAASAARYTAGALAQARRADGGRIPLGLGGPREDNVLAAVSSGEFVVNAAMTDRYLPLLEALNAGSLPAFADGGQVGNTLRARASAPLTTTSASSFAISSNSILNAITASDVNRGANADYAASLDAQAEAAKRAAAAELSLDQIRERAERRLDNMQAVAERAEEAQKEAQEAAIEAAEKKLDLLKRANDDARDALKQRNDDEADALKTRNEAELSALKAKSKNQAAITALQQRQDAAEKALKRKQDDAEKADARQREDEEEAAQERIKEAKKANTRASKELAAANEALYDSAKAKAAREEEAATEKLRAAKEAEAEASRVAAEAERKLNEQRQKAAQLAEQAADAVRRGASLTDALNDTSGRGLKGAGIALGEASAGADDAARVRRDESAVEGLQRRAQALETLTSAAQSYAAAQRAYGVDEATIGAGLDQTAAKIADLGARYGLTAQQVSTLTGRLDEQRTSAEELLNNFTRRGSLSAELAGSLASLESAGLSQGLLDQVLGSGNALQLARTILAGGVGLISALNSQQNTLDAYANGFGSQLAANRYGSAIYSPTGMPTRVTTAVLDPSAAALITQVAKEIASRPNLIKIGEREVVEVVTDAVLATAGGTYAK